MEKLKKGIPYLFLFLYIAVLFIYPPKYINYPKLFLVKIIKLPLYLSDRLSYNIYSMLNSKALIVENRQLRKKVRVLEGKLINYQELRSENDRLKKIVSFKEKSPYKLIVTKVISKDSSNLSRSIIIGAGKKQGIKEKTPVIIESGLVGRVVETFSDISRVLVITDPNSRISAINSRSRSEGMVHGISNGLCKMVYLPLNSDIKNGDIIVTSGFSSFFPKGLLLGRVVKIVKDTRALSLHAIVKPSFELSQLEEVMCIKD